MAIHNSSKRGCSKAQSVLCLTALSLGIGGAVNAYAQQQTLALEEVIVTASRRESDLQTIPTSIAALTGSQLADQGILSFKEVSEAISGITLDFPSNAINAAIYMRGVGTTGAATVQSVSTMIDGVYQIRQGLAFTELMDINRVEVLRGPQGTMFGKNSTSGAIRIFTNDPDTEEFSGHLQGVAGSLDQREARGMINIPLIEGKLAARLSGYNSNADGYTNNWYLNEDTRNVNRDGWRAKLLWNATDNIELKFSSEHMDQTSDMDEGITQYGPKALANAALLGTTLPPVSIGNYAQNIGGKTTESVKRNILNTKVSFWGHTLTTLSSWEDNKTYLFADRDETAAAGQVVGFSGGNPILARSTSNSGPMDITTHEIQIQSDSDGPLSYLIGYMYQDQNTDSITAIPPIFSGTTKIKAESWGVFTNATYTFNDQWSTSLGLRYDEDERTGSNGIVGPDYTHTFDETTYSAKLMYQYDANKMFYLAQDKGWKSGGVNREFSTCARGGPCLPADDAIWDPEIAYNYEIGMKTQWLDNTLRVNGAIFYTKFDDFQVSENIPAAVTVLVSNAAEVEAKGIEVDFTGIVTDNITVNGSLSYVKSEYNDYKGAPCDPYWQSGCVNGTQDLSGETLDHAPELSFNLGAEYRAEFGPWNGTEWFARADVIYKDDQNLYVYLTPVTEEGSYTLLNLRAGLEMSDSWKLTFWGKNVTDEKYRTAADTAGDGGLAEVPGLKRTLGVTADWYF